MEDKLTSIIDSLTEKQRRDLIVVDDWNRTLNMGRGLRTGRYLAKKGLVRDTGEMYNYSTRWIITDLGKKVAEKLNMKT